MNGTASLSWVIGRGGLLGRHVEASLAANNPGGEIWRPVQPFPWSDPDDAADALRREASEFFGRAVRFGAKWRLLWCAGSGVIATSSATLSEETTLVSRFTSAIETLLSDHAGLARQGTVFFASSAGGVYAASPAPPPFDEDSPVRPLAPYGREKLFQEELFARLYDLHGVDLLIGRLTNLYGPSQNLAKPQGLIAHVGSAALRRQPVSIYVPLDTIRDYLFAPDAGRMIVEALDRREDERREGSPAARVTKIFASEVETTVAAVLGAWRRALRRPLPLALGTSPTSHLQPRVLSFRSRVWPDLRRQPTRLGLGIDAVRRDQLTRMQRAAVERPPPSI